MFENKTLNKIKNDRKILSNTLHLTSFKIKEINDSL